METPLLGKVAVVTGFSRGIGAAIAVALAEAGADIVGGYVDPAKEGRARNIHNQITGMGARCISVLADLTTTSDRAHLLKSTLTAHPEGIDYLVLNAAGGLEQDKPAGWAETINIHSQVALVETFLPVMKPGGVVLYVTSLWAHKYGEVLQVLPGYEPVARTKHLGEKALRDEIPHLAEKDVRLLIECGHMVSGTGAYTLFKAVDRQLLTELEKTAEGGKFATPEDMGKAARDLILSDQASGSIVFVGGTYAEPLRRSEHQPFRLDRGQVAQRLRVYGPSKLLIDEFESHEDPTSGTARYTVKTQDCEGHFGNEFSDIQLFRGVDQIEAAAQALALTWLASHPESTGVPVFKAISSVSFDQMVFPGYQLTLHTKLIHAGSSNMKGDCEIRVGNTVVSRMSGVEEMIIPNIKLTMKMIKMQLSLRRTYQ
jgi:NAD(P)-dependent dehydrogenase (short-subunit alcohol dehydrogenase family)/3-hydroxymyristoyl/3-hydroxydecanoyl-(acyl carrier protein) dehydratase